MEELVKALALMKNVLKEFDWAGEMLEEYSDDYVPNLEQRLGQAIFLVEEFVKTNGPIKLYIYGDVITLARSEEQAKSNILSSSMTLLPFQSFDGVLGAENAVISFDQDHIYEDIWLTVNGKKL